MRDNSHPGLGFLLLWHALVLTLLMTIPSLKLHVPFWSLNDTEFLPFLILLGGYVVAAAIVIVAQVRGQPLRALPLLLTVVAIFGLIFLYLLLRKADSSRVAMLLVFIATLVAVPLSTNLGRLRGLATVLLAAAAIGIVGLAYFRPEALVKRSVAHISTTLIKTGLFNVRAVSYQDFIPAPAVRGGGLRAIGSHYLLATGEGLLYLLDFDAEHDKLRARQLPYRIPINGDKFAADTTGRPWHKPQPNDPLAMMGEDAGNTVITWWFRVTDVLVQDLGAQLRIYAAHYFWKSEQSCWVERVSVADSGRDAFISGSGTLAWRTLFETQPCLPIKGEGRRRGTPFAGHFGGGRLALRDAQTLFLSVGDFGFNGVAANRMLSQDPTATYGKIISINLQDGSSEIYSSGVRNPQGLYIDPNGAIWETEHGPQGGDELNLIKQHLNYGWPIVTYGVDYGTFRWPLNPKQGEHEGYEAPFYAWMPSIGVSNLVGVEKDLFPTWKGDLLVSSLVGRRVFRVRIRNDRVAYAEPILIDTRIRDIAEGQDGQIVLWADDDNEIITLRPLVGTGGEAIFATSCSGCHKLGDGTSHRIGPDLWGVIGRDVASADGYVDYSPALRGFGGKWNEQRLEKFITNPQHVVPGTAMEFDGLADANSRRQVIDYIKHAPKVISR